MPPAVARRHARQRPAAASRRSANLLERCCYGSALALGHCHERGRCVLDGLAAAVRAIRMGRGMFCEMLGFLEHMAALLAAVLIDGHGNSPTRHAPQAPPGANRALRGMMAAGACQVHSRTACAGAKRESSMAAAGAPAYVVGNPLTRESTAAPCIDVTQMPLRAISGKIALLPRSSPSSHAGFRPYPYTRLAPPAHPAPQQWPGTSRITIQGRREHSQNADSW